MVDRIQIMFVIYAKQVCNANYDSEKLRAKHSSRLYHLKIISMEYECHKMKTGRNTLIVYTHSCFFPFTVPNYYFTFTKGSYDGTLNKQQGTEMQGVAWHLHWGNT